MTRVRFAPSPTGKLHVGGARTAIYNWAFARATGGTFILRIDDTDPTRSTEENTQIILRAMKWLGLDWDEGPDVGGPYAPYKQTDRLDHYRETALNLVKEGKAYYCFCTSEELEEAHSAAVLRKDVFQGYQRTCRNIDPVEAQARVDSGEPHTIRIKVPKDRGDVIVHDAVHGEVTFNARELDDFIIFRSDGTPTYNFTTVVDDADMKISHVIRGDDHLSNTPRQVIVYEALGAEVPTFAHISMILGPDGKKLSKRHGATSVEEYRDAGYDAEAFVNYLALLGWSLDGETTLIPRDVLASKFSLEHVSKNPATFDPKKLDWLNATYLSNLSDEVFTQKVIKKELIEAGLESEESASHKDAEFKKICEFAKPRVKFAHDIVSLVNFLYLGDTPEIEEAAFAKALTKDGAKDWLEAAYGALENCEDFKEDKIDAALAVVQEASGVSKSKFYAAIRAAVTCSLVSPPLGASIELLGKESSLARIKSAINKIESA